jgi:hypothetical protein
MLITNLLTNMMVVTMLPHVFFRDTPAGFERYEAQRLTDMAQLVAPDLGWNTGVITTNAITARRVGTGLYGLSTSIVINDRYCFREVLGTMLETHGFVEFKDQMYCEPQYSGRIFKSGYVGTDFHFEVADVLKQWSKAPNLLTMDKAQTLAEAAFDKIRVPINRHRLKKLTKKFLPDEAMPYYYTFVWSNRDVRCQIDVSGVNSNIVFFNYDDLDRLKLPTNYLQLMGIASNTVFVAPVGPTRKGPPYRLWPLKEGK